MDIRFDIIQNVKKFSFRDTDQQNWDTLHKLSNSNAAWNMAECFIIERNIQKHGLCSFVLTQLHKEMIFCKRDTLRVQALY